MKNTKVKGITLLVSAMVFSLSISSQVSRKQVTKTMTQTIQNRQSSNNTPTEVAKTPFWREDFGVSEKNGDQGNLLIDFQSGNGKWTVTKFSSTGQKPNQWYVSAMEAGIPVGSCSDSWLKNSLLTNNTLHIGAKDVSSIRCDFGAIYNKNESSASEYMAESPEIVTDGKSNIVLNFDYFVGGIINEDFLSLYIYNGTWTLLETFSPSPNDSLCAMDGRTTWMTHSVSLPSSVENMADFKLGFKWKNTSVAAGHEEYTSVAIDNIILTDNTPTVVVDPSASTNRVSKKTKNMVETTPVRNIEFTVYPNPNSGQFTIDFAGIENNHEVQIVLSDLQTGKQLYTTTFFSSTIEHNKIDVNPTEKIKAGRYSCSLICEGIRLTKQVVIN
jgi:hypothetical protein